MPSGAHNPISKHLLSAGLILIFGFASAVYILCRNEKPNFILLAIGILIAATSSGLFFIWRHASAQGERVLRDETEQLKKNNNTLLAFARDREDLMQRLFDAIPVGIYTIDPSGTPLSANPALLKMLGLASLEELVNYAPSGATFFRCAGREEIIKHVRQQHMTMKYESSWERPDGRYVFLRESIRPVFESAMSLLFYQGTAEDFTDQRIADEQLRTLSRAVEQSSVSIAITGTDGTIEYVNPKFCEMTGYSPSDVLGQNIGLLKSGQTPPEVYRQLWTRMLSGGIWQGVFLNKRRNGQIYPEWNSISAVRDAGNAITHFVAVKEDISERQRFEERQARLIAILEATPELVTTATLDGSVSYCNAAARKFLGIGEADCLDSLNLDCFYPARLKCLLREQAIPEAVQKGVWTGETVFTTHDGKEVPVSQNLIAHRKPGGEVEHLSMLARDISEQKQAQNEVLASLKREQELGELKSSFVSIASHQFRTPLTTILGSAEMLEHYSHRWDEEKKLSHLRRIQESVLNMTSLLNDVLLFGRAEAGKLEFAATAVDLKAYCHNLVDESQDLGIRKHTLLFSCEGDDLTLMADEKLLRPILVNLLSNAAKYSAEGGRIWLHIVGEKARVVISIRDEGMGVPEVDLPHLFEPFHRANNVVGIPGTGLGLSITKRAVELHNGTIEVISRLDEGSTFIVALPRCHSPA